MLKKQSILMFCVLLFLYCTPQIVVATNHVSDINIDVLIYEDGSAYITQTWNCNFTEGTEVYLPIENLGEMSITDFQVSDDIVTYEYIEDWKSEANFHDKASKCGTVKTEKGVELCWGITQYGEQRYAIEYKINNIVASYNDYDGFLYQFINSGMGTLPTNATVNITMQNGTSLEADHTGIWAFGFDGQIDFEEGKIVAYTKYPLASDTDSVIIMLQLNKGLIHPARAAVGSFEDVKAKAFEGSDYNQDFEIKNSFLLEQDNSSLVEPEEEIEVGLYSYLMMLITFGLPLFLISYAIKKKGNLKKKIRKLYINADYNREAPIAGNLEANFVLAKSFNLTSDDGNLIGAAFLKLINAGCLEPMNEKKVGLFGKEKESISLKLIHPPQFSGRTVHMLYDLLVLVSGTDQILQENELESYCRRNHAAFIKIIDAAMQDGQETLVQIDCYDNSKKAKPIGLSPRGEKLLFNIMGLKKFLLEFSLINERTIAESIIWQDYLTFATLLGIANKVIEQFEKIYPEVTHYSENAHYYYMISHRYTKASYGAAQSARFGGSGGSSSFGGGGGFSGGGVGGGTR